MLRFALTFLAMMTAFLVTGCIDVEKVITVNSDGSGTVTETVVLAKAAIASLKEASAQVAKNRPGKAKGEPAASPFKLVDEKKLREAAGRMGDGVTLISTKAVTHAKGEGYTAVYAFHDIRTLKLNQNPLDSMIEVNVGEERVEKPENITFDFIKGAPAKLVVKSAPSGPPVNEGQSAASAGRPDEMGGQMLQQILKDMRVAISIRIEGTITDTDAEYHDDARVTLMDIDFNKVLADREKMKALLKANPDTFEKTKTLVRGIEGLKIETKPAVTIKFQ
jgi:hypothetical protein